MCNNGFLGQNCCTWLLVILLVMLFNNGDGILGGCGCGGNGNGNGCGCGC